MDIRTSSLNKVKRGAFWKLIEKHLRNIFENEISCSAEAGRSSIAVLKLRYSK